MPPPFLFVERGVHIINVFLVYLVLCKTQAFAKSLEMDDFPRTQEFDDVVNIRVVRQPKNVVVGNACFLLCCNAVRTTSTVVVGLLIQGAFHQLQQKRDVNWLCHMCIHAAFRRHSAVLVEGVGRQGDDRNTR